MQLKKVIQPLVFSASLLLLLLSCSTQPSLQKYFVEKLDDPAFMVLNLPLDLNELFDDNLTQEELKVLKGVDKLNLLLLRKKEDIVEKYDTELKRVQSIIAQPQYQHLMDFKAFDNAQGSLLFEGEIDQVDEGLVFFHSKTLGFGVMRIIGSEINPGALLALAKKVDGKRLEEKVKSTTSLFDESLDENRQL